MLNLFIRNDSLFSLTRHAEGVKRPKHLMTSPLSNKILRFTQNDSFLKRRPELVSEPLHITFDLRDSGPKDDVCKDSPSVSAG